MQARDVEGIMSGAVLGKIVEKYAINKVTDVATIRGLGYEKMKKKMGLGLWKPGQKLMPGVYAIFGFGKFEETKVSLIHGGTELTEEDKLALVYRGRSEDMKTGSSSAKRYIARLVSA